MANWLAEKEKKNTKDVDLLVAMVLRVMETRGRDSLFYIISKAGLLREEAC